MVSVKVLPFPSTLVTVRSPPSLLASRLLIANPNPVPPKVRVMDLSACVKGWNSLPICSCPRCRCPCR